MNESFGHYIQSFEQQATGPEGLQPLLELIVEQSGVGIIVADSTGVLRAFNAEAERQHGKGLHLVPAEKWIQTYGLMGLDGSLLRLEDLALYRALRGERVDYFSYLLRTTEGDERVIAGNANPLRHRDGTTAGAVVITRDETEHHRAAQQLQHSRSELRRSEALKGQMITNSADCLLVVDTDGRVDALNGQAFALLGVSDPSAPPAWHALWPGKRSRRAAVAAHERALCGQVARFEGRTELIAGQTHWWSVMLCPIREPSGQVDTVFAALRDVTTLKEAEQDSRGRAVFAQQLMGIVSHDLRNPVGAILLSASVLKRRTDLDDKAKRSLDRMIWSAERANRLIFDLLDFTQAQLQGGLRITRAKVNTHDVVQRMVDELRAAHPGRRIELVLQGDPEAEIDSDRVSQVITNLVANAMAYSPADAAVRVYVTSDADSLSIRVHNEGEPIDAELLPKLFTPMQRGDKSTTRGRSIGLGLYIVKLVAQAHGGDVSVSSGGTGTDFVMQLPKRGVDVIVSAHPM